MMFYGWNHAGFDFSLEEVSFLVDSAKIVEKQVIETGSMVLDNSKNNRSDSFEMEHKGFVSD